MRKVKSLAQLSIATVIVLWAMGTSVADVMFAMLRDMGFNIVAEEFPPDPNAILITLVSPPCNSECFWISVVLLFDHFTNFSSLMGVNQICVASAGHIGNHSLEWQTSDAITRCRNLFLRAVYKWAIQPYQRCFNSLL